MAEPAAEPVLTPIGDPPPKAKRHVLLRLFGITFWGWLKLILLCILVGVFVIASEFDPASPDINVLGAVETFFRSLAGLAGWAVTNFWKPAVAGAGIVLPIWFLWRLLSLPFRK